MPDNSENTIKITYRVMLKHGPGAMSEEFEDSLTHEIRRSDMHAWGAHVFTGGFRTLEATAKTLKSAQAWGDKHAAGAEAWVEKVTEVTTYERV